MGLFSFFKPKATLNGSIELRGLPANRGYNVSVCLFRVEHESAPQPFDGEPPPSAYKHEIWIKEFEDSARNPLIFTAVRRPGFFYVDVGLIVLFEHNDQLLAQVEHFMPTHRPCRLQSAQTSEVSLVVDWPDIPPEQLHHYGTIHPEQ